MEVICITGMHRSGTSVIARITNLLGIELGEEGDLIPEAADNPRGYWENASISALNQWVLERMGGSWDAPPILAEGWEHSQSLDEIRVHAIEAIQKAMRGARTAGFKDPRASLTLPFWRTIVPVRTTVMALRHPAEVAASLRVRNGIDSERSSQLWLRYVVSAYVVDPGRLIVPFDDLLGDLTAGVSDIANHLGLDAPGPEILDEIKAFVEPSLRHHRDIEISDGPNARLAEAVFRLLKDEKTRDNVGPLLQAIQDGWNDSGAISQKMDQLQQLARIVADSQEQSASFSAELRASLMNRVAEAERLAARFQDELAGVSERAANMRRRAESAELNASQLEIQLQSTHEAALTAIRRAEGAEQRLAATEDERTGARQLAAVEATRAAEAEEQLARTATAMDQMRRRKSVRLALFASSLAKPFLRLWHRLRN